MREREEKNNVRGKVRCETENYMWDYIKKEERFLDNV
jgi:hypothetical protein